MYLSVLSIFLSPIRHFKWFLLSTWRQCHATLKFVGLRLARLRYFEYITGTGRVREEWENEQLSKFLESVWSRHDEAIYKSIVELVKLQLRSSSRLGKTAQSMLKVTGGDIATIDAFRPCLPGGCDIQVDRTVSNLHYIHATLPSDSPTIRVALIPFVSEANPRWAEARIQELLRDAMHQPHLEPALLTLEKGDTQLVLDYLQEELDISRNTLTAVVTNKTERQKLCRLVDQMSRARDMFPRTFFIPGLSCNGNNKVSLGTYSDLYAPRRHGVRLAVKHLHLDALDAASMAHRRMAFWHDALMWRQLWHPNIVPIEGIDRDNFPTRVAIVLPWFENGNILDFIRPIHPKPSLPQLHQWITDIARGLEYLHSESTIHGAIRGRNVLVDSSGHACLTDFGIEVTTYFGEVSEVASQEAWWYSPELIIRNTRGAPGRFTYESDVFAFAVLCTEIFTCERPFSGMVDTVRRDLVARGGRPDRPLSLAGDRMGDHLWSLLQQCWAQIPEDRPNVATILQLMEGTAH